MKFILIAAPGDKDMRDALNNKYVNEVAEALYEIHKVDRDYFRRIALLLRNYYQGDSPELEKKLQALRKNALLRPNASGQLSAPEHIDRLIQALAHIYGPSQKILNYRRGAIVELFVGKLVRSRCASGEYFSDHKFVESQYGYGYASKQIDVIVFSEKRQHIEGYSCKVSAARAATETWESDCSDLVDLVSRARSAGYFVHVGVVCFEDSNVIRSRLENSPRYAVIHAYGVDNIYTLQQNPFTKERDAS
jgi:hypothetical protein